jgi:hypothetical protein
VVLVGCVAGFTAVACLLIWSGHVLLRPFGWRIVVDAQGLCVERIGMFGRRWPRRRRLSLRELEELRTEKLGLHWRLLAIGDRRIIPIGSIFTHADVHALRQEMVLALRAEAAPR